MLPYLFGWSLQGANPSRAVFGWLGYNLDDSNVYLSWMRQVADGGFFQRNLFTTEPQSGHQFSFFILLLGWFARLTSLPLIFVYHLARTVFGLLMLMTVWRGLECWVASRRTRRFSFLTVCFGAGLGWLPGLWHPSGISSPTDVWQPETVTFLCLYLSPLFCASLWLMLEVLIGLWRADEGERRGVMRAGAAAFILGNIHTYDILTLGAVWGAWLLVRLVHGKAGFAEVRNAVTVGFFAGLSTAYMFWLLKSEVVFAKRAAVPTLSGPLHLYLLGMGLLLPLAALGMRSGMRGQDAQTDEPSILRRPTVFLGLWAVVNLLVAYAPVAFQRKMAMGIHLPVAILAGVGLAWLLRRMNDRRVNLAALCCTALLFITNARFMLRDAANAADNLAQTRQHRTYLFAGEVEALKWLRANTPQGTPIQPLPWISRTEDGRFVMSDSTVAVFAPGITGRPVHAGHWGETPDYGGAVSRWSRFLQPMTEDSWRHELVRAAGVKYLVLTQIAEGTADPDVRAVIDSFRSSLPPWLTKVPEASNPEAEVYRVAD
jgi:hypothetical protein